VSSDAIAFAYANNIWVVPRAGGAARRLTSFQGETSNPKFSPDGRTIAFSAEYGGNTDVYVVPAAGGQPTRLTWHPGADQVQGWTPDGKAVVFASGRATDAPSAAPRFWTVAADGGVAQPMVMPRAYQGKIAPDGRQATAMRDYDSTELSVGRKEVLEVLDELGGWYLCRTQSGMSGWVPSTSVEVMEVFQRLNSERGITVLLITHERDIAEYGTRVVAFRDGHIVSDEKTVNRRLASEELKALPPVAV
jgi:dipeptidyl aminopeptidase/acylaminoacyl peptidase